MLAEMRVKTLYIVSVSQPFIFVKFFKESNVPRLAQLYVCKAILVAKGNINVAKCIEWTAVETYTFLECLEYECPLID